MIDFETNFRQTIFFLFTREVKFCKHLDYFNIQSFSRPCLIKSWLKTQNVPLTFCFEIICVMNFFFFKFCCQHHYYCSIKVFPRQYPIKERLQMKNHSFYALLWNNARNKPIFHKFCTWDIIVQYSNIFKSVSYQWADTDSN